MLLQRRHTNGQMKWCSRSLIIREMQMNPTVRYHLTPVRMAIINKSTNNRWWWGCGKKGTLMHCWWELTLYSYNRKLHVRALKIKHRTVLWSGNLILGYIFKETQNTNSRKYVNPCVIHNSRYGSNSSAHLQRSR